MSSFNASTAPKPPALINLDQQFENNGQGVYDGIQRRHEQLVLHNKDGQSIADGLRQTPEETVGYQSSVILITRKTGYFTFR